MSYLNGLCYADIVKRDSPGLPVLWDVLRPLGGRLGTVLHVRLAYVAVPGWNCSPRVNPATSEIRSKASVLARKKKRGTLWEGG